MPAALLAAIDCTRFSCLRQVVSLPVNSASLYRVFKQVVLRIEGSLLFYGRAARPDPALVCSGECRCSFGQTTDTLANIIIAGGE